LQEKSSNSVKVRYAPSKDAVKRRLASYLRKISAERKLYLALLFGSYAKGDYGVGSDVDLLLVCDGLSTDLRDRLSQLSDPDFPVDLEPFAYTVEEFEKMGNTLHPLAVEALSHGEVLYAAPEIRDLIRQLRTAIERRTLPSLRKE